MVRVAVFIYLARIGPLSLSESTQTFWVASIIPEMPKVGPKRFGYSQIGIAVRSEMDTFPKDESENPLISRTADT